MKPQPASFDSSGSVYHVRRSHPHRQLLFIIAVLWGQIPSAAQCVAQTLTVPEMLSKESQWKTWAAEGRKVLITGRYRKREDQKFFLNRLPLPFLAPKANPLPEKLPEDQPLSISGKLLNVENELSFEVNGLKLDESDVRKCVADVAAVAADQGELLYEIADRYQLIADFYEDRELLEQARSVRTEGFQRIRQQKAEDPDALWEHAETAVVWKLPHVLQLRSEVRFQALLSALNKPSAGWASLLAKMKLADDETGWATPDHSWNPQREQEYQKDPLGMYQSADNTLRVQLRRRIFREFRKRQLLSELTSDGSNGIEIARLLQRDIPEDPAAVVAAEEKEVQFLLQRIGMLNRRQLETLCRVLLKHQRADQADAAQDQWLTSQEERFKDSGLDGQLRLADEFFFVANTWDRGDHQISGIEVLKAAWTTAGNEAPPEAEKIAERLKAFGWERVQNQWMTSEEISSLPKTDIQRAMREGRVVAGMTAEQVAGTLGRPSRVTRMASGKLMRELWVYDAPGTAGVVVQFVRSRGESANDSRVSEVGKVRQR